MGGISYYCRPQGKVMFSEASVSHSIQGVWGGGGFGGRGGGVSRMTVGSII